MRYVISTTITFACWKPQRSANHQRNWKIWCHVWWNGIKRGHLLKSELARIVSATFLQPAFPRLGATVFSSYTLNFHTRLFSALPPSFTIAFKELCACLLAPPETDPDDEEQEEQVRPKWDSNVHAAIWKNFEILGLIDRYESIIASVGYEYIEEHVLKTCAGEWAKPMLEDLRVWMSDKVVPWMLHVYARGASNCTCYLLSSFWVVMCLTIKYSWRSENYAARRWFAFWFSYK